MGFFGYVIDEDGMEVPIPEHNRLRLLNACVGPEALKKLGTGGKRKNGEESSPIFLYAKTDGESDCGGDEGDENGEGGVIIGVVDPAGRTFQCSLGQQFGEEDGALRLWTKGGELHITGEWTWDDDGCEHDGDDNEDMEECEDDQSEMLTEEDEAPELVPIEDESTPATKSASKASPAETVKKGSAKHKISSSTDSSSSSSKSSTQSSEPAPKKPRKIVEGLGKWKVGLVEDEGVVVPEPKMISKEKGLKITDYVIGNGPEPKPGATVKILYEGYLTDGTLFDCKKKRKEAFAFRKGVGQVIKGMDKGLEGMRIGGAREIFVPSSLGYGVRGVGTIPPNADLIFRMRLLA